MGIIHEVTGRFAPPAPGVLAGGLFLAWSVATAAPSGFDGLPIRGDATQGRAIFNGKGVCFYCHGTDGYLDQRPRLSPDTESVIAGLTPAPSDLRNPITHRDRSDADRFRTIREGHSGSGMLPDPNLSDEEIHDLLAYLSMLRDGGHPEFRSTR